MKIVFVSSCGIPNNYGGFEQFAGISHVTYEYESLKLHIL